ncbi:hypothetical protein B484DRAFT_170990 [Ochromonadaceae sp. CCMP2298]|nr:hypothetical protein B484DRAFT_170990 [Ochromonadaceae sp. CCMP2298]
MKLRHEAREFLDQYLYKVIHLMTQQSPSKMGSIERNAMEECIYITLKILTQILPSYPSQLQTLCRLMDASIPFYDASIPLCSKVGSTYFPVYPSVRTQMARRFAQMGGYGTLLRLLQKNAWPGAEALQIVLKPLEEDEILSAVDPSLLEGLMATTMSMVLELPDEQIRRESTESIAQLIHTLSKACSHLASRGRVQAKSQFHSFWFANTLNFLDSQSLVMNLFAWDQLGEIIAQAEASSALEYILEGAGTTYVNGTYTRRGSGVGGGSGEVYTKPAEADVGGGGGGGGGGGVPLLTLFRCTMRTEGCQWWFLSQADADRPGSDEDMDYYLHKSDQREPPLSGWISHPGVPSMTLLGAYPPPTLKRGMGTEYLTLLEWLRDANLLKYIFCHPQIISRARLLLLFLSQNDQLRSADLHLMWTAAMDTDDSDEVFLLLVPISPHLSTDLFNELVDLALQALQNPQKFEKIEKFIEKFWTDRNVNNLTETATAKLFDLVWAVYVDVQFEGLLGPRSRVVQELLSCLGQRGGRGRIVEYTRRLDDWVGVGVGADAGVPVDEAEVQRVLATLDFLLKHTDADTAAQLQEEGEKEGMAHSLVQEVRRFVKGKPPYAPPASATDAHKPVHSHPTDTPAPSPLRPNPQLAQRLRILRQLHAHSSMPYTTIAAMWEILSQTEINVFFIFLRDCYLEGLLNPQDARRVFQEVCIEGEGIDWAGEAAFSCFEAFFTGLRTSPTSTSPTTATDTPPPLPPPPLSPPRLGLDTLWRIALSVPGPPVQLLLSTYHTQAEYSAYEELLSIVFAQLRGVGMGVGVGVDVVDRLRVSQCISIVSAALMQSKGVPWPAHGVVCGARQQELGVTEDCEINATYQTGVYQSVRRCRRFSGGGPVGSAYAHTEPA